MVKNRKTKAPRRRSLKDLKSTPEEEDRRDEEQRSGTHRGPPGPAPAGSFGLLYTRQLADYHTSGGRDARITLRLHPDLRDLLIVGARRDNRTLS